MILCILKIPSLQKSYWKYFKMDITTSQTFSNWTKVSQIKGANSCLLDRNAEQILTEHVFLPLRPVPPSSASTALRGGQRWHWKLHHLRCNQPMGWSLHPNREWHILLVLSLSRSSFAVAIKPSINVVHCWARPAPETTTFCRMSETTGGGGSGTSTSAGGISEVMSPVLHGAGHSSTVVVEPLCRSLRGPGVVVCSSCGPVSPLSLTIMKSTTQMQ